MDFNALLSHANSPDPHIRTQVQAELDKAREANFGMYVHSLAEELGNSARTAGVRQLAGILVKNALASKNHEIQDALNAKWLSVDPALRTRVKDLSLGSLIAPDMIVRTAAAQAVSQIASVELPSKQWDTLIPLLLQSMNNPSDDLKQATLETLGFICDALDSDQLDEDQSNKILTAIVQGMSVDTNNVNIRRAAAQALFNALEFASRNFEKENERTYIMTMIYEACKTGDNDVRFIAWQCMVKIALDYYDKLPAYMQTFAQLSVDIIRRDEERVALQALEFWTCVAEEEVDIKTELLEAAEAGYSVDDLPVSHNLVKQFLALLIPVITESLTKQEDGQDEDDWNVSMASATLLTNVSLAVGDEVVPYLTRFIGESLNSQDWHHREAAYMSFGCMLDGPSPDTLKSMVQGSLAALMGALNDPHVQVKDTAVWTLARLIDFHHTAFGDDVLMNMIPHLIALLNDAPRVANQDCFALGNLAKVMADRNSAHLLTPHITPIIQALLVASSRPDADNLRPSAYQTLNEFVGAAADDAKPIIVMLLPELITRLKGSFGLVHKQAEVQGLLCGSIQIICGKIGEAAKPYARDIMECLYHVFRSPQSAVIEDALLAIGDLADILGHDFQTYVPTLMPVLLSCLNNCEAYHVCRNAVGAVSEICRCVEGSLNPYCDQLFEVLIRNLQNPNLNRSVKPPIFTLLGDLAISLKGGFEKFLPMVCGLLQSASAMSAPEDDPELVEYIKDLRVCIFDCYTGILSGLIEAKNLTSFQPYAQPLVQFVELVAMDTVITDEALSCKALGVMGDLGRAFHQHVKPFAQQPFFQKLLMECKSSKRSDRKQLANWVEQTYAHL